jgi:cathepsin L
MRVTKLHQAGLAALAVVIGLCGTKSAAYAQQERQQISPVGEAYNPTLREQQAAPDIRQQLGALRQQIQEQGLSFEVGYTAALDFNLSDITGLIVPDNLSESARIQNQRALQLMAGEQPVTSAACSPTATSFDWRHHNGSTPVRDQGACGSCWAFATLGAVEGGYATGEEVSVDGAEQHLLDCAPGGCGGGWWAFNFIQEDEPNCKEADYP